MSFAIKINIILKQHKIQPTCMLNEWKEAYTHSKHIYKPSIISECTNKKYVQLNERQDN